MAIHNVPIDQNWFDAIRSGLKTVEGKKGSPTWSHVKLGDTLRFISPVGETYDSLVDHIVSYSSVEEYLIQEGLSRTIPGTKTFQEALKVYLKPTGYWEPSEVSQYGVLAFYLI
ncbi:MAG: ASCH domain-containing protein [Nitrososphaerales archaeon]